MLKKLKAMIRYPREKREVERLRAEMDQAYQRFKKLEQDLKDAPDIFNNPKRYDLHVVSKMREKVFQDKASAKGYFDHLAKEVDILEKELSSVSPFGRTVGNQFDRLTKKLLAWQRQKNG